MRQTETERSLDTISRLHDEIMRERAEGLHESAQSTAARLVAREEALARLRGQVAMLKASLHPAPVVAAPVVAVKSQTPVSLTPIVTPVVQSPAASTRDWKSFAPYAAIAACALGLELGGVRAGTQSAPNLSSLVRPAAAVVLNTKPAAKGAPVLIEDDRSDEALMLVHEWKLPGDEKSLGERLGRELDLPGGRPAWKVDRTGAHGYRVTFQPAEKDLPYAFEADIDSRVVWPTPETQELLAPRFTAAFRDAVR